MLIRMQVLEQIKSGQVSLAFRKWRRATVKSGGTLKTPLGVLSIKKVEIIDDSEVSNNDAVQAGYSSLQDLCAELNKREGDLYKISLAYAGEYPRIKLRENEDLGDGEYQEILARLERFDASSRAGNWTYRVLTLIEEKPHVPAARLAAETGTEKARFKTNVRKLKNLGLTISHNPGYTLSPRGKVFLERLNRN